MHLFSTHSWLIVHWNLEITIVFPEFLSYIYRCGTLMGFGVLILIFHLASASACSVSKPLLYSLSPSITVVTVNPTSAKLYLHNSSLWAVMRWLANSPWASVLFMQEKHTLSHIYINIPPGSMWHWLWQESELDSGQSHIHSDTSVVSFFHTDPSWIIKPW